MLAGLRGALPGFAEALEPLDAAFARAPGGRRIAPLVFGTGAGAPAPPREADLRDTRHAQPALGLVSAALFRALAALGARPAFLAGHSYGELPALFGAGGLDGDALARLSFERGRLLGEAGDVAAGAMTAVMAPRPDVAALVAEAAGGDALAIANLNAPTEVVVSGAAGAVARLEALCAERGLRAVRLRTACAFHSPLMAPVAARWRAFLEAEARAHSGLFRPEAGRVLAGATAAPYGGDPAETCDLLARGVTEPVRWVEVIEALYARGVRTFVEVGPGRTLTGLTGEILAGRPHAALACDPARGADPRAHVGALLAQVAEAGAPSLDRARLPLAGPRAGRADGAPPVPAGSPAGEPAAAAFFETNRAALEAFFAAQARTIELAAGLAGAERAALFLKVVESGRALLADFLATQEAGLRALAGASGAAPPPSPPVSAAPAPARAPASAAPPPAPAAPDDESPAEWLASELARVTGFPRAAITLATAFERDLGLDSITMFEVFHRLIRRFPAFEGEAARLRAARTVADVAAIDASAPAPGPPAAGEPAPAPGPPAPAPVAAAGADWPSVRARLVRRIAEVQGEEPDAITDEADLEADLDLDVFTREEILGHVLRGDPRLALAGREALNARTLGALGALLVRLDGPPAPAAEPVERFVFVREPVRDGGAAPPPALPEELLFVGPPGPDLDALRRAAAQAGARVLAIPLEGSPETSLLPCIRERAPAVRAALYVAGSPREGRANGAAPDLDEIERAAAGLFILAKAIGPAVEAAGPEAWLGVLGRDGDPVSHAARGVARALAREWPAARVRSVLAGAGGALPAARLLDALARAGTDLDLVLAEGGELARDRLEARPSPGGARAGPPLGPGRTVVATGGGDGITAEAVVALARAHRCAIAAIGRTRLPAERPYPGVHDDAELKARIFEDLEREGAGTGAEALRARLRFIARQRAIFATRERVERAGGTFRYYQADATDPVALARALAAARAELGPIHGAIHGAGVIEDELVAKKSLASFRRVFRTKVAPAIHLRRLLADDPLAFVFLFSSMVAFTGTPGQTDYVAANEALDALARAWNRAAPYPVRALLWSVWSESGLASASVRAKMARLGLGGITNDVGARLVLEELRALGEDEDRVLLAPRSTLLHAAAPPPAAAPAGRTEREMADHGARR